MRKAKSPNRSPVWGGYYPTRKEALLSLCRIVKPVAAQKIQEFVDSHTEGKLSKAAAKLSGIGLCLNNMNHKWAATVSGEFVQKEANVFGSKHIIKLDLQGTETQPESAYERRRYRIPLHEQREFVS